MNRLLRCGATCLCVSLAALLCLSLGCAERVKEAGDKESLDPALSVVARHPIGDCANQVAVSPAGTLVACGNAGYGIDVINVPLGVKVHTFPPNAGERAYHSPFAFSGDSSLFVIADRRRMTAFNVANWAPGPSLAFRIPEGYNGPNLAAFPRSRDFLLTDYESLFRWTPGNIEPARLLKRPSAAHRFELFPDGRRVVSLDHPTSTLYQVWINELKEGSKPSLLEEGFWDWCGTGRKGPPAPSPDLLTVSPTGTLLAAPTNGSSIWIWDLANGGKRRGVALADGADHVAFLPGGQYLICSCGARLTVVNAVEGKACATSTLSSKIKAIAPFQNEPKLAVLTEMELLIVAIDLAAVDKKNKP